VSWAGRPVWPIWPAQLELSSSRLSSIQLDSVGRKAKLIFHSNARTWSARLASGRQWTVDSGHWTLAGHQWGPKPCEPIEWPLIGGSMVSCSRGRAAGINLHRSRFRRAQGSRQGEQVGSLACLLTRFEAAGSGSRRERERARGGGRGAGER